eukprot:6201546-Pyramimonas_sp.AAC.1
MGVLLQVDALQEEVSELKQRVSAAQAEAAVGNQSGVRAQVTCTSPAPLTAASLPPSPNQYVAHGACSWESW